MSSDKFYNLHLTRGQSHNGASGMFKAIVRLAHEDYRPPYMRILGEFSPGFLRAELPYHAFSAASNDAEVLAVELRAVSTQSPTLQ